MELQLYKALVGAGVKEQDAAAVVDSLELEIKERMSDARKELVTKADLAEAKTDIIKWNLATIAAVVGVMLAMSKAFA
jgi:hypothetical protein